MPSLDDLLRRGRDEDYETVEAMILSGQIDAARAQELLRDYPEFGTWYLARAARRVEDR